MASPGTPSKRRSVLLLSQFPPPFGGLTVHSERLRAALEREGFEVSSLTPPARQPRGGRLGVLAMQAAFFSKLLLRRCDLVHDHVSTYPIGERSAVAIVLQLTMLVALRFGGSPWVVTCGNGLLPGRLSAAPAWHLRIARFLYSGAAAGIAKNEPIARAFAALGLGNRTTVVGTFLEPVRGAEDGGLPPEVERFLATHPVCIVTAGFRFEPLYHLEAVVRAAAWLRQQAPSRGVPGPIGLVVMASKAEDPEGVRRYEAALRETGIGGDVLLLRDVDYALALTARGSVFVRATDFDGDANTVKEAMLVGVPVLATALPGRPPGVALLEKDALETLGPRLLEILARRDDAQIAANRAFVREDIGRNTRDLLAVYARAGAR